MKDTVKEWKDYRLGENIFKSLIWQRTYIQNVLKKHLKLNTKKTNEPN